MPPIMAFATRASERVMGIVGVAVLLVQIAASFYFSSDRIIYQWELLGSFSLALLQLGGMLLIGPFFQISRARKVEVRWSLTCLACVITGIIAMIYAIGALLGFLNPAYYIMVLSACITVVGICWGIGKFIDSKELPDL